MKSIWRVVDIGGGGARRADVVCDGTSATIREGSRRVISDVFAAAQIVDFAVADLPPGCDGIIYAVAGTIANRSLIEMSPNATYLNGFDLGAITAAQPGGVRCIVLNDLEGAAPGMAIIVGKTSGRGFACTWSTGFGGRILVDGNCLSPQCEPGHMVIQYTGYKDSEQCGCTKFGHPEGYIGGAAVIRRVQDELRWLEDVNPGSIPAQIENYAAYLDQQYDVGEPWARLMYGDIALCMGALLTNILSLVPDIEFILWKGTFAKHALKRIEESIRESMARYLIKESWADVPFIYVPSGGMKALPNDDTFIGGAMEGHRSIN